MNTSDNFQHKLSALHRALGIAADYTTSCKLPLCVEPDELVDTELDYYNRRQRLTPAAFESWSAMRAAAHSDDISLFLISAYRSLQYQHDLIAGKLAEGRSIEQILAVNAAPGFSEHHTGRAVDVGTEGCDALQLEFENTEAFRWLSENAQAYGFHMTYPRHNPYGIDFEPWHWCFNPGK